ncbi:hypothetical protein ACJ73_06982 [Blastomyces percursus]|uniref:Major facilitator superfamily (MFS) profile domain-containing protein n=1 Tax=Blastomyces percursus TaxID=1658174 RepID=A0A1J9QN89_9EURO|nr:hypothetical protein ACJ73_06982 [Blastomyces percursus]
MAETSSHTSDGPPISSPKSWQNSSVQKDGSEKSISSDDAELKYEYPNGFALTLILTSVTLAYFLFFIDIAVISTATPAITSDFDTLVDVGWYGGAYQLGSAAFQPLSGKIYSQFPIKWTFLVLFFVFEVGSAICGAAQSSPMFIIGLVITGVGSAGVANGAMTTISSVLPIRKQALLIGINMGMGKLGPVALAPHRRGFYHKCVVAVKSAPLEILGTVIKSLDLPGFMLICPAVVMFLLVLQFGGNQHPWNTLVDRQHGDEAVVPFAMLKYKVIWSAAMTMFFNLSSVLVADFYIAIYFQAILNDSPLMSGVHMLPITLGLVLFTVISGVLISVMGYYLPFVPAGGAISAIGYGLLSTLSPTTPAAVNCVPDSLRRQQIPQVMAIIIFWQKIGASISLIAANAIFSNSLRQQLQQRVAQVGHAPDVIQPGSAPSMTWCLAPS